MKDNEFIVRVKGYDDDDKEVIITAFSTNNLFKYIKIINYLMKNKILLNMPSDSTIIEKYRNECYEISDFEISIASHISKTCLDIWVEL